MSSTEDFRPLAEVVRELCDGRSGYRLRLVHPAGGEVEVHDQALLSHFRRVERLEREMGEVRSMFRRLSQC